MIVSNYLKRTNFRDLKKSYFASTYFREWKVFENFEFTNFCESTESEKKTWLSVKGHI